MGGDAEGHSPSQACGSTRLILPVTIRLNMRAARRPPRSDPQKSRAGFGTARADAAWDRNHRRKRSLHSHDDTAIVEAIAAICDEFENYGWRRVRAELRHRGVIVNHKKIRRLMRAHHLPPGPR